MNEKTVTMSKLGNWGRFANQIFQYAFLRLYCKKWGLQYQIPSWIGQKLFNLNDPPITNKYPLINEGLSSEQYDGNTSKISGAKTPFINHDLIGYFQYQTSFYAPHKEFIRSLFKPINVIESRVCKLLDVCRAKEQTLIGIHLRRGDYGTFSRESAKCFFIAPCEWYVHWLNTNLHRIKNPVIFLASDELHKVKDSFKKYNVVTNEQMDVSLPEAPFYPDFYVLSKCNIMLISNSSFSFAASMLNDTCVEFYRPRLSLKKLISYDPWNSHTIFRDENY